MSKHWQASKPLRRILEYFGYIALLSGAVMGGWAHINGLAPAIVAVVALFVLLVVVCALAFLRNQLRVADAPNPSETAPWKARLVERVLEAEQEAKLAAKQHEETAKAEREKREALERQQTGWEQDRRTADAKLADMRDAITSAIELYDKKKKEFEAADRAIRAFEKAIADNRPLATFAGLFATTDNEPESAEALREKVTQARNVLREYRREVPGYTQLTGAQLSEVLANVDLSLLSPFTFKYLPPTHQSVAAPLSSDDPARKDSE